MPTAAAVEPLQLASPAVLGPSHSLDWAQTLETVYSGQTMPEFEVVIPPIATADLIAAFLDDEEVIAAVSSIQEAAT